MAACTKCGKAKLKRRANGRRVCDRCGCQPSNRGMDQGGNPMRNAHEVTWREAIGGGGQYEPQFIAKLKANPRGSHETHT